MIASIRESTGDFDTFSVLPLRVFIMTVSYESEPASSTMFLVNSQTQLKSQPSPSPSADKSMCSPISLVQGLNSTNAIKNQLKALQARQGSISGALMP